MKKSLYLTETEHCLLYETQILGPLPAVPASHTGAGLSPGCSTSDPAPCQCTWENRGRWPKALGLCTHMGDPEAAAGS